MSQENPQIRTDLQFFPIQNKGEQVFLIKDHLGLVEEGKAVPSQLYSVMALLDGATAVRDIQMALMRQRGGILVGTDEVKRMLAELDQAFLLNSERFKQARQEIVAQFSAQTVRPCALCGPSYPAEAAELKKRLDEIMESQPPVPPPRGRVTGLIAPHIDLSVGYKVYASAYKWLKHCAPSRVVVLGVGHQMDDLFSLTEKDFETPLGLVKNERAAVHKLMKAGQSIFADSDFAHKSEHSVEFQVLFLQHLFPENSFTIIPILCGPLKLCLPKYTRDAYVQKTGPFLKALSGIFKEDGQETLLIAGVDFSHIGPKFGHDSSAALIEHQSKTHDQNLLNALSEVKTDAFWEESIRENDQFNVCGFSAMACLLEVLPASRTHVLDYQIWHEQPTRSAVSFAAVAFTSLT